MPTTKRPSRQREAAKPAELPQSIVMGILSGKIPYTEARPGLAREVMMKAIKPASDAKH
jgi:hypothetical protein